MRKWIIVLAAAMIAAALSTPAAMAEGHENGLPSAVCVEGFGTLDLSGGLPPLIEQRMLEALERGTVWLAEDEATGDTFIFLSAPPDPDEGWENIREVGISAGACATQGGAAAAPMPVPARGGYCAAAGNTNPFTGDAIRPGTFLNLLAGQPLFDDHYRGATPANFVDGKGLTCDPPPAGFVQQGTAGAAQNVSEEPGYPLWVRG